METIRRNNGIIIRSYPTFRAMTTDVRQALEEALQQLQGFHPSLRPDKWTWTDKILPMNFPDEVRTAAQPELLRVTAGAGTIKSDGFDDPLDYGYWVFVPRGVDYSLRGTIIAGQNFRVVTLRLK